MGIPLVSPPRRFEKEKLEAILKRTFDVVGASILLVLFSPFFGIVAAAIKLTSRGPVFFKQKRSLSDRAPAFEFYKFRTMKVGADLEKSQMVDLNESNGALFKIRSDPRITEVGRILRKHSIDELPQLINVLKGEMSLAGPRPLPVEDYANVEAETKEAVWYRYRAKARPGMTGLWQIGGRSDVSFEEMALLDMYYVENQSFLFDIEILLETIPCVLLGKGAY